MSLLSRHSTLSVMLLKMTKTQFGKRLQQLQTHLTPAQAILLSRPSDIRYSTGLPLNFSSEREALLLITTKQVVLLHSPLLQAPVSPYFLSTELRLKNLEKVCHEHSSLQELFVDLEDLRASEYQRLQTELSLSCLPLERQWLSTQRMHKDAHELKLLKTAAARTDQALSAVVSVLKPGVTESAIAAEIEYFCKKAGCELSFPPIVAFGENTAVPHHLPGATELHQEMAVLIDLGARYHGYCGDLTRSGWFGASPPEEYLRITQVVEQAYTAAFESIAEATGRVTESSRRTTAGAVDTAARAIITAAGYGSEFFHTTGHGIGLDAHEQPALYEKDTTVLTPGMVVTIEPGIYLSGKYGVRYENTVCVTEKGGLSYNQIGLLLPPAPDTR